MTCELCGVTGKEILYEDQQVIAIIRDHALSPGQVTVFPRKHFTILEQVPKDLLRRCSVLAKKVSVTVFEALGSTGTNISIRNGLAAGQTLPHFAIDIIPRSEQDGVNLQWTPKQFSEVDLETIFSQLTSNEADIKKEFDIKKESPNLKDKSGDAIKKPITKDKNYLLKSLRRIP